MTNKTLIEARKGDAKRLITRERLGWKLPPEEGPGAYIGGTGAFQECVKMWKDAGWTVQRKPNPSYRPRPIFGFI